MAEQLARSEILPQDQVHPEDNLAAMNPSEHLDDTKMAESTSDQPAASTEVTLAKSADHLKDASEASNMESLSDEATAATVATSANPADELERKRQELLDRLEKLSDDAEMDHQSQSRIPAPRLADASPSYPYRIPTNLKELSKHRRYDVQKTATWSPDGKCVLSTGHDHCLRTSLQFPKKNMPSDYPTIRRYEAPEDITAFAPLPCFDTDQDDSMLTLVSANDLPIRLFNVNEPDKRMASYSLQWDTDDMTELKVGCIKFKPCGQQFICTGERSIALFDANRPNEGPLMHERTVPSNYLKKKRTRWGPKYLTGRLSDMDYNCQGMLAVSTYSSQLGFYDDFGAGEAIWTMDIADIYHSSAAGNKGILWVRWSPDGNYLYVAERNSDEILVMDIRKPDSTVTVLTGRHAMSTQRLGFGLIYHDYGHNVVAGGSDGVVRMWEDPATCNEESKRPDFEWKAHDTAVACVLQNPRYPQYLITVTGEYEYTTEEDYNSSSDSESNKSVENKRCEKIRVREGNEENGEGEKCLSNKKAEDSNESMDSDDSSDSDDESQNGSVGMAPCGWMKTWEFQL